MSVPKTDKWVLVEWNSGDQNVVNAKYLAKCLPDGEQLYLGKPVVVGKATDGSPLIAKILGSARARAQLEQHIQPTSSGLQNLQVAGPSTAPDDHDVVDVYSPSASDWEPSAADSSSEEWDEKENKSVSSKSRRVSRVRRKNGPTPSHRPKAVLPRDIRQRALRNSWHSDIKLENVPNGKESPASLTRSESVPSGKESPASLIRDIRKLHDVLNLIFVSIKNDTYNYEEMDVIVQGAIAETNSDTASPTNTESLDSGKNETDVAERSEPDHTDRSDDNVLITNKHVVVDDKVNGNINVGHKDWIPIGSGTTKIHKDKYRTVNWKSYTMATRTLLLAAFSRRVLATHSLTGKKSPAFSNKPAKMCLDPKIVSDIVIEIARKFKIKDGLVRNIITTKCADECKMFKMQMRRRATNRENISPPEDDDAMDQN